MAKHAGTAGTCEGKPMKPHFSTGSVNRSPLQWLITTGRMSPPSILSSSRTRPANGRRSSPDCGIEQYVSTPELHSENTVGQDPLPPGQVWAIGPREENEGNGLYKIEVTATPGSSIRLINVKAPSGLRESIRAAEQVLYTQSRGLLGDHDPKSNEFAVQIRALSPVSGAASLGVSILLVICSAGLRKSLKGGVVVVGGMSVGGTLEPVYNALDMAELAAEKGAVAILLPVASRKQMNEMSDELAARLTVIYYTDPRDALLKVLGE